MSTHGTAGPRRLSRRAAIDDAFAAAVVAGLAQTLKSLPCRYFYDARGSALFEDITRLAEYYPTRAEAAILEAHAGEMVAGMSDSGLLIELGSGSSLKTEILLAASSGLRAYLPIDVSVSALDEAAKRLKLRFPQLDVRPVLGDFSCPVEIPEDLLGRPRTGFFPGSTIGNLTRPEAASLLAKLRGDLLSGGRLIIGVDLKKDARRLVQAYNDAAGVTAAFNLNLLARINRDIEPAFDLHNFRHEAIYDPVEGRIEMHLVAVKPHHVRLLGHQFHFQAGETIHTENSYKYSIAEFQDLCRAAGWRPLRVWTDSDDLFSVHQLTCE